MAVSYYPENDTLRKSPVVAIMFYIYNESNMVKIEYFVHSRDGYIENGEESSYHIGYEHEFDEPYDWKDEIADMKVKHNVIRFK